MESKKSFSTKSIDPFFAKVEKLSKVQRILLSSGIFLLIIGCFVYFLYMPKFKKIDALNKNLKKLEKQLEIAKRNAANLKKFQAQMAKAEAQFREAMKALPEQKEIPSLLTSISKSGQDVGMEFLLFEPKPERKKDFYAEIPVAMNILGDFHNLAVFFDKVARLSRIVNIQNISMGRAKAGQDLNTTCTAVTYKFVEPEPAKKK
jgi:type IV pilus assembly protein PilO